MSVEGYLSDYLTYRPVSSGDLDLLIICWIYVKNFSFSKKLLKINNYLEPPALTLRTP